jgi:hypothetical protein
MAQSTASKEPAADTGPSRDWRRGTRVAERDALYDANDRHREAGQKLAAEHIDDQTTIAVLGLRRETISRLYRVEIIRLRMLLETPVDLLWRSVGRHGVGDILERLEYHGLSWPALGYYEKWRLGRMPADEIPFSPTLESAVADLWPRLGVALTEHLQRRGIRRVADLVPDDDDTLLQLYRLGKANLRKIRAVVEIVARNAQGADRQRVRRALQRLAARSERRRSPAAGSPAAVDPASDGAAAPGGWGSHLAPGG